MLHFFIFFIFCSFFFVHLFSSLYFIHHYSAEATHYFPQVFHVLKLKEGQDITALALNKDNTNLLVSTADKQLIIFTDPAVSLIPFTF